MFKWCRTLRKGKCCLNRGEKEACSVEFGEIFRKKFLAKYEGG